MFSHVGTDLRLALRKLRRQPLIAAAVLASIAIGSGATTALFTVVDRLILRPLPIAEPDRVHWVRTRDANRAGGRAIPQTNPGDVYDLRTRVRSFAAMASYNEGETTVRLGDDDLPERLRMAFVEPEMLRVLGMQPLKGRFFNADDYASASPNVVITHRLWRRMFASDTAVIGRTIYLGNVARTVIGVLPPAGDVLPQQHFDLWRPLADNVAQRMQARTATFLRSVARIGANVSVEAAQTDLDGVARQIAAEQPQTNAQRHFVLEPLKDGVIGPARATFRLLGGAVAALLLIACAGVSTLLVARAQARTGEMAVRAALGGSAHRLAQQTLIESALLCVIGAAGGLVLAPVLLRAFVALYPGQLPRSAELALDWRTVAISLGAIVLAGVAASVPAIQRAARLDLSSYLASGRATGGRRERRFAGALVIVQIAVSIVLLFGGTLLLKSYRALATTDPGFETEHLLSFNVGPSVARYSTVPLLDAYYDDLLSRIRALPNVAAAGTSNLIPFDAGNWSEGIVREGTSDAPPNNPFVKYQLVSDDFIQAVGLTLMKGRGIEVTDRDSTPPVVVVNAAFAAELYPGQDVLGKRITMRGQTYEIAGVVSNKRHTSMKDAPIPEMFVSRRQAPRQASNWVMVRTTGDPRALVQPIRALSRAIDPTIAVAHLETMEARRAESVSAERFRAIVVSAFALAALLVAAVGLYGVVAFMVARRTREIGIRMALGERRVVVVRRVIAHATTYCATGVAVGVIAALFVARLIETLLVNTSTHDAGAMLVVIGVLALVTLVAAWMPAVRASRIDPMVALRND